MKKTKEPYIFSLDIGTRNVVGVVGQKIDNTFHVIDYEVLSHPKRSMMDGQIEDIDSVSYIVGKVTKILEKRLDTKLKNVAIAAAGRALKTMQVKVELDNSNAEDAITEDLARSFEMEAISSAQQMIDSDKKSDEPTTFFCVGHSIIEYALDGYPMKSIIGHRGSKIEIELIAAFLPSVVVESLYSVIERNKLKVSSLTLEPIAAMNVIVPPEVRLINIALVDIGAGTSDIAISKNGSIIAYAMATTAGDEITEEIIKQYLVDFETAEQMKIHAADKTITYKDILGCEYTIKQEDFHNTIFSSVNALADTISQTILNINGGAPSAVFLAGGGSLIHGLTESICKKLDMPASRIALSGSNYIKSVVVAEGELLAPDFVTPIGIGASSIIDKGYDFSNLFLNDKKFKVFNTKGMTVFDVLIMGGYKARDFLGRAGANLTFSLNDETINYNGESAIPAVLTLNDEPTTLHSQVSQYDRVNIVPAVNGASADVKVLDVLKKQNIFVDEIKDKKKRKILVNGKAKTYDYKIKNGDVIYYNNEMGTPPKSKALADNKSHTVPAAVTTDSVENTAPPSTSDNTASFKVNVNGVEITLSKKEDAADHLLLEILEYAGVNPDNPSAISNMAINDIPAKFTSVLKENDKVKITFDNEKSYQY